MRLFTKNDRGFTLVEVIVVLVVLAILAAVMIPSLTGYIDKTGDRGAIAECRQCVLAAQTLASERYAAGQTLAIGDKDEITALAESPAGSDIISLAADVGKLSRLVYLTAADVIVTYDAGSYTVDGTAYTAPETPAAISGILESIKTDPAIAAVDNNIHFYSGVPGPDNKATTKAGLNAFLDALPNHLKASLIGKTWSVTTTSAGFGSYKIVVYDGDISTLSSSKKVPVTIYDSKTGTTTGGYRYPGTATVNGVTYKILGDY